mgnify:CR=1 FL=1
MRQCSRPAAPYPVRTGAGADPALSPALSAATTARQPLAPAAALTAAEDVEAVADRRTILITTAAADCPVGGMSMGVTNGGISLILGWQDTLLTVEKRLWREQERRR